jgi:V/A-type H+-transporting ATPase subunit I
MGVLKRAAAEEGWAIAVKDPAPEDRPPTLMIHKTIGRLIRPLFSFLGTFPGYWEYDITLSYLLFFSVFFAMILGDAGYGIIILAGSALLGIKSLKNDGKVPDVIKLFMLLGTTTIVWGAVNGSWFAIPHTHLPAGLYALIFPPFNPAEPMVEFPLFLQNIFKLPKEVPAGEFKTRWCIQFFCFTMAGTQLAWARIRRVFRLLPSLSALAQVGWVSVMLAVYFLVLSMLLKIEAVSFMPYLIGVGIFLIFVFSEQKGGNFFVNIGKCFANFFQVFLKAVGCFADIISYIRLFAVGMAGAMIGKIIYSMAVPSDGLGSFGLDFIIRLVSAVMILAFGHGLNILLNALSVIVHGVRLNLLEYAGNHLDMEWSGYEYDPFAVKIKSETRS